MNEDLARRGGALSSDDLDQFPLAIPGDTRDADHFPLADGKIQARDGRHPAILIGAQAADLQGWKATLARRFGNDFRLALAPHHHGGHFSSSKIFNPARAREAATSQHSDFITKCKDFAELV